MEMTVRESIADLVPRDSPAWYAIGLALPLFVCVVGAFTAYLRSHGLYLRL